MNLNSIKDEFKIELCNPDAWFRQTDYVLFAIFGVFALVISITLLFVGSATVAFILVHDGTPVPFEALQFALKEAIINVFIITFIITSAFVVMMNLPGKLKNVFRNEADHIDTTERLLLRYRLISQEQVDERIASLAGERLI